MNDKCRVSLQHAIDLCIFLVTVQWQGCFSPKAKCILGSSLGGIFFSVDKCLAILGYFYSEKAAAWNFCCKAESLTSREKKKTRKKH